jgi:hypothetical protein
MSHLHAYVTRGLCCTMSPQRAHTVFLCEVLVFLYNLDFSHAPCVYTPLLHFKEGENQADPWLFWVRAL